MNLFCFWPWVARPCDVFYKKCILLHMKCSNVMYVFRIIFAISRQFQTPSHVASGTCLLLCLLSMLKLLHNGFRKFTKFFNVKSPIMDPITKIGLADTSWVLKNVRQIKTKINVHGDFLPHDVCAILTWEDSSLEEDSFCYVTSDLWQQRLSQPKRFLQLCHTVQKARKLSPQNYEPCRKHIAPIS